jgi:hypothetical protein
LPFLNSIDALRYALRDGEEDTVKVLCDISYMRNGLKYCSVQVTCVSITYHIEAYGEEADELYKEVKRYTSNYHNSVSSDYGKIHENPGYTPALIEEIMPV